MVHFSGVVVELTFPYHPLVVVGLVTVELAVVVVLLPASYSSLSTFPLKGAADVGSVVAAAGSVVAAVGSPVNNQDK